MKTYLLNILAGGDKTILKAAATFVATIAAAEVP